MKYLLTMIVALVLSSCGEEQQKSLFSAWSGVDDGLVIDLTGGSFGSSTLTWFLSGGYECVSTVLIGGTEDAGSAAISGTTYVSGTGNGVDPGCSSISGSVTFTRDGSRLTICGQSGCQEYI
jgi:hypothetical protein